MQWHVAATNIIHKKQVTGAEKLLNSIIAYRQKNAPPSLDELIEINFHQNIEIRIGNISEIWVYISRITSIICGTYNNETEILGVPQHRELQKRL